MIRLKGMIHPVGTAMQSKPGKGMIRLECSSRPVGTAMSRPEMAIQGTGMIFKPVGMSRPVGTAMQTKQGTSMIRDMFRFEGMSRPEGSALQTKPSTAISRLDIDDEMFWRARRHFVRRGPSFQAAHRLISRAPETACTALVGSRLTAVSVKSTTKGTGMVCDMARLEGMSNPEGTVLQTKLSTAISRLGNDDDFFGRARRRFVRRGPAFQAAHGLFSPRICSGMCSVGWFTPHRSERGKLAKGQKHGL
jgi:hypothetical protein